MAKKFLRMDAVSGSLCAFEKAGLAKPQLSQLHAKKKAIKCYMDLL
jgi:hypothetical protein